MSTHSPNTASANTGEGCPRATGRRAPNTMVRDVVRGRLVLSKMGAPMLRGLIARMAERIRELEKTNCPLLCFDPKTGKTGIVKEPRRRAHKD